MVSLRPATCADSEFAYTVKRAAFRSYFEEAFGRWDEAEQWALHERRFATQPFRIVVADGRDVGVVCTVQEPECLKLNQLYLLPEAQGCGVGSTCLHLIQQEAAGLNLPIRLQVLRNNPRARAFYERLGFVLTGETATHDLLQWSSTADSAS